MSYWDEYDRYPSTDCTHMIRLYERLDHEGARHTKNERVPLKAGDQVLIYSADEHASMVWAIGDAVPAGWRVLSGADQRLLDGDDGLSYTDSIRLCLDPCAAAPAIMATATAR